MSKRQPGRAQPRRGTPRAGTPRGGTPSGTAPRRRWNARLAALIAAVLVVAVVGVVVVARSLGGGSCGDVLGDRRLGEDVPLSWSAEPGPEAAESGAVEELAGTEAIGEFRGAVRLSDQAGGTTVFSTARDSIITISLANASENQVARSFIGVSPDAEFEPWARSFTADLVAADAGAGVVYVLGRDGDALDVVSVNGATGEERWCRSISGSAPVDATTAQADRTEDGDLMVGRARGEDGGASITRLAQDDGDPTWTTASDDLPVPTRLVAGEQTVAFGGRSAADERPAFDDSDDAEAPAPIVGLSAADGTVRWRYAPAGDADTQWHPYLIGEADGVFVVLEHGARRASTGTLTPPRLVGLDANGEVVWSEPVREGIDVGSDDVLLEEGVVVLAGPRRADGARELSARNVADGSPAWTASLFNGILRPSQTAVSNGWLLNAGLEGVESVDLATGDVEVVLDTQPIPDIAAEPGGFVAVEVDDSILIFDAPE